MTRMVSGSAKLTTFKAMRTTSLYLRCSSMFLTCMSRWHALGTRQYSDILAKMVRGHEDHPTAGTALNEEGIPYLFLGITSPFLGIR